MNFSSELSTECTHIIQRTIVPYHTCFLPASSPLGKRAVFVFDHDLLVIHVDPFQCSSKQVAGNRAPKGFQSKVLLSCTYPMILRMTLV